MCREDRCVGGKDTTLLLNLEIIFFLCAHNAHAWEASIIRYPRSVDIYDDSALRGSSRRRTPFALEILSHV